MVKGSCFCAGVEFELHGALPKLYQCHCSLCRKVTGSAANAAMIVAAEQFEWVRGQRLIGEYVNDSGFKSHFCSRCGSPLPNLTRGDSAWWIPVGLLEDSAELELGVHLYTGSRAGWDRISDAVQQLAEMPPAAELDSLLRRSDPA